jgi:hypothetical protein
MQAHSVCKSESCSVVTVRQDSIFFVFQAFCLHFHLTLMFLITKTLVGRLAWS